MFHVPNKFRIRPHQHRLLGTKDDVGNNGAFKIDSPLQDRKLWIIASNGAPEGEQEWEHVSVHVQTKNQSLTIPRWEEMCFVKDLFWDEEDMVIQYHPKKSEYVNMHEYTLHLWRPVGIELPTPPKIAVGV